MYSRVAAALDLNYRLLIGKEYYDSSISLNTIKVTSEFTTTKNYRC